MANRHFGKIADVWKHAVLAEVLEREPPGRYAETHAGSAAYPLVHDRERQFGILRFLEVAPRFAALARSPYRAITASYVQGDRDLYPGSALLAMTMLGDTSSYLLCDLDKESITDLRHWSRELGLRSCEVAETDGMAAVAAWLDAKDPGDGLVHIDPFDPDARNPGGFSALELGRATTPGTGFGVVLANVREDTPGACAALGSAFCDAYADTTFPDGQPGHLAFTCSTSGRSGERT